MKAGCTYTFIDPSVIGKDKEFTVKAIRKDHEQGPKTAAGEQYFITNEGWWISDFPIGGNDKFIQKKCKVSGGKKTKMKTAKRKRQNENNKKNNIVRRT